MSNNYDPPNRVGGFYEGRLDVGWQILHEFMDSGVDFLPSAQPQDDEASRDAEFDAATLYERLLAFAVSLALQKGAMSIAFVPAADGVHVYLQTAAGRHEVDTISRRGYEGLLRYLDRTANEDRLIVLSLNRRATLLEVEQDASEFGMQTVLRICN